MKDEYNIEGFINLLEQDQILRTIGTTLKKQDELEYLRLKNYSLQLNDSIYWSSRTKYLELMKSLVSSEIDGKTFYKEFSNMVESVEIECRSLRRNLTKLQNIEVNPQSSEFSIWVSEVYFYCDEFYPDYDAEDFIDFSSVKNEEQFRTAVGDMISKIEEYL